MHLPSWMAPQHPKKAMIEMDSPTMMTRMEAAFATSGVSMISAKSLALMRTKIPQIRRARPTTRKMRLKAKRQYFMHLFPHPLTIFGESDD